MSTFEDIVSIVTFEKTRLFKMSENKQKRGTGETVISHFFANISKYK